MGSHAFSWWTTTSNGSLTSQSSILSKLPSDLPKINIFKSKCQKIALVSKMKSRDKLDIINDALSDLDLSSEPIENYYTIGNTIGAGKYGVVKWANSKANPNLTFAVKIIELEKLKSQFHSILQEILALKKIDHPNVVKIFEIFKDSKKLYIVLEHVEGKELFDFIVENQKISEHQTSIIAAQLIKTVKYLNKLKICHRDLKPENIIINPESLHVKIVDFGLSSFYSELGTLSTKVGTPYYVAPEVLNKKYGKEWDMWSIGVITYVLLTGCPPIQGKTLPQLFERIKKWELKYMDDDFADLTTDAYNFVKSLLCVDITKRLTPDSALTHKWILQTEKRDTILNERYKNKKSKLLTKFIISKLIDYNVKRSFIEFNYLQILCLILFKLSFYCKHSLKN